MDKSNLKRKVNKNLNIVKLKKKKIIGKSIKKLKEKVVEDNNEENKDLINEENEGSTNEEIDLNNDDAYVEHLEYELSPEILSSISSKTVQTEKFQQSWPSLGSMQYIRLSTKNITPSNSTSTLLESKKCVSVKEFPELTRFNNGKLHIKSHIVENIKNENKKFVATEFTSLQKELLTLACNYHDIYYPEETFTNEFEIRMVYCSHVVNHVLKSRQKVMRHNYKLKINPNLNEDYRDQGLVRPKVLILLPTKRFALNVVKTIMTILLGDGTNVMHKNRFLEEYSGDTLVMPKYHPKPPDYVQLFSGNTDDNFKIGISVTKKALKLYSDFYSSDIIIASPLGLRMLIGSESDKDGDYDFLASIEILIMDFAQMFIMQNWDHVLHIMDHLHLQPKDSHGTNLARVRMWALNGLSRYYRQTLIFCSHQLPELTSLLCLKCSNYGGKVVINNNVTTGSIRQIISQIPQVFHLVNCNSVSDSVGARFNVFLNKFLNQFNNRSMKHTLIYVPSYFDYVKIRNYFKKQDISFVQICEYSKDNKIARARDMFFHGESHFLLYSERYHFFHRRKIRGIRHILFYQPPSFPNFYSEMCNLIQGKFNGKGESSITTLYTQYDIFQLSSIIGTERATKMLSSNQAVHMFMTEN